MRNPLAHTRTQFLAVFTLAARTKEFLQKALLGSQGRMIGTDRRRQTDGFNGDNEHSTKRNITVAVEGNIGSGKTSLLKYFKQNSLVEAVEEPVKKWQKVGGGNTLELMYSDPKRWSFMFESYVLLTMMDIHNRPQNAPVRLLERSAYSANFCFVENQHRSGSLSSVEYTIFQEWFAYLMCHRKPQIDLIVYLRTSPENCMERIKHRSRNEEISVSMELLNSLHERHEDWLVKKSKFFVPAPVLVVDGNQSLDDMFQFYETNKQLLLGINCSKTE